MVEMLINSASIGPIDSCHFSRDIIEGLSEQSSKFGAYKYEVLKMYTHYMETRSVSLEN